MACSAVNNLLCYQLEKLLGWLAYKALSNFNLQGPRIRHAFFVRSPLITILGQDVREYSDVIFSTLMFITPHGSPMTSPGTQLWRLIRWAVCLTTNLSELLNNQHVLLGDFLSLRTQTATLFGNSDHNRIFASFLFLPL